MRIIGITGMPEVQPGDDLPGQLVDAARNQETPIESGDILVVTQKIVSKAEGRIVDLNDSAECVVVVPEDVIGVAGVRTRLRIVDRIDLSRGIVGIVGGRGPRAATDLDDRRVCGNGRFTFVDADDSIAVHHALDDIALAVLLENDIECTDRERRSPNA
ncbi:MAG: coenzyme F420-0:L-glutamate ligase [Chloroflexi bacterium]|nr:coenzyme F420-0:L-glutamate ligase [Chloroflexota bacterium]